MIEDTTGGHPIGKVFKKSSDAGISLNGESDLVLGTGGSTNSGGNTNYFNFKDPNLTPGLAAPVG